MFGTRVYIPDDCTLVGLGIGAQFESPYPHASLRLGLYDSGRDGKAQRPENLIQDTAQIDLDEAAGLASSNPHVFGAIERRVAPIQLQGGRDYWLFAVANGRVFLRSNAEQDFWYVSARDIDYASLTRMPPTPETPELLQSTLRPTGALYAIVVRP
jgi:hypothetical protein